MTINLYNRGWTGLLFSVSIPLKAAKGLLWWLSGKESACNAGDTGDIGWIPGLESSSGGGNGNPLQYSCLKKPMDRGPCWVTFYGVAESGTAEGLKQQTAEQIWTLPQEGSNDPDSWIIEQQRIWNKISREWSKYWVHWNFWMAV